MPHLTLEYTSNLISFNPRPALLAINTAMINSALFSEPDIKSRALAIDCFQIGLDNTRRGFVHVRIAMLSGRSESDRKKLADTVLAALRVTVDAQNGTEIQLSVETTDLDRPTYAKAVING